MTGGNKESKRKKKDKWQEAGGEFYQECYPADQGQGASTADLTTNAEAGPPQRTVAPRPNIPLPSQTARRNSLLPSATARRGQYLTRKQSYNTATATLNGNGNNFLTYTSTMGRIPEAEDVHISLMPDLADETIPDEKVTYEALQKLRTLPESLYQKRLRKEKLGAIPQRRLGGYSRFRWNLSKALEQGKRAWYHDLPRFTFWRQNLQEIETRCGTPIANVFGFIRWSLLLNVLISLIIIGTVIIPYIYWNIDLIIGESAPGNGCPEQDPVRNATWDKIDLSECCVRQHSVEAQEKASSSIPAILTIIGNQTEDPASLELTPFYYGYYIHYSSKTKISEFFPAFYIMAILVALSISFLSMFRSIREGIKEIIKIAEGHRNQYTDIIFAGWDHYTRDAKSTGFKRKVVCNEMKIALRSEKSVLETMLRTRNQQIKLNIVRIFVNLIIIFLAASALFAIYLATEFVVTYKREQKQTSKTSEGQGQDISNDQPWTILAENIAVSFIPSTLIITLNLTFTVVLARLGNLEKYSAQICSALVLIRAIIIRILSLGVLGFSLYYLEYCDIKDSTCTVCEKNKDRIQITSNNVLTMRDSCYENIFAEHLYKILFMDLLCKVLMTMIVEPIRVQFKSRCKNKSLKRIGGLKFIVVRHTLDIIYLQLVVWIGMFFAPLLPIVGVIYLFLIFYIKKCSLLCNCNAVPDTHKTMKASITLFVSSKLFALISAIATNAIIIGLLRPSQGCGPFREYQTPWESFTSLVAKDKNLEVVFEKLSSPGPTFPLSIILIVVGYYYYRVAHTNRAMVETLKHLLVLEGHDKQFLFARLNSLRRDSNNEEDTIAGKRSGGGSGRNNSAR